MFTYKVKVDAGTESNFFGLSDFSTEHDDAYAELIEATTEVDVYEVVSPIRIDRWLDTRPGIVSYKLQS